MERRGKPYNLASDEIALAVAEALKAEKLFFVTDSDGFMESRVTLPPGWSRTATAASHS